MKEQASARFGFGRLFRVINPFIFIISEDKLFS